LYSVRFIYDVDGWAYHHRARALQKYAPPDFEVSMAPVSHRDPDSQIGVKEVDIVCLLSQPSVLDVAKLLAERGWRSRLITSWNAGFPMQLAAFYVSYGAADAVIINNAISWDRVGRLPRTRLIPNGVDRDIFHVRVPIERRKPKVLWVGSELHRRMKGYDAVIRPLADKLAKAGIDCETHLVDSFGSGKRSQREMAELYNSATVLLCASTAEGTPNTALEAAASGCTVVSTPVGNMPELIRSGENGYLVERNVDAFFAAARSACEEYPRLAAAMQRDIESWGWRERSVEYYDLFRDTLAPRRRRPRKPDLSDRVSVFVTTVGAESYATCREHLRLQDSRFELSVIRRVAPMNAAFQRMLDRCRTPFFVQVDEDMVLYPHAIRSLYEKIAAEPDSTAILAGDLYDPHLDRCIVGVKIYRHDVVRRYPFANVRSFEKLQVEQMAADGYRVVTQPVATVPGENTLGLHGTHWTPRSIYERYQTLEARRWQHPGKLGWFAEYHRIFLQRFIEDPTELNFFALAGLLSGALVGALGQDGDDKDYRKYRSLPGFREAERTFAQLKPPKRRSQHKPQRPDDRPPTGFAPKPVTASDSSPSGGFASKLRTESNSPSPGWERAGVRGIK
jgi:glycosyltransferase involved in cell wall biosynthesis